MIIRLRLFTLSIFFSLWKEGASVMTFQLKYFLSNFFNYFLFIFCFFEKIRFNFFKQGMVTLFNFLKIFIKAFTYSNKFWISTRFQVFPISRFDPNKSLLNLQQKSNHPLWKIWWHHHLSLFFITSLVSIC